MLYIIVFIFWFSVAMSNHTPVWNSLLFAAFWTIVGSLLLYLLYIVLATLGIGSYGIFKLFKKLF